jgi:hypothetical protein
MTLAATWIVALSLASLAGWLLSLASWLSCPGYLGTFVVPLLLLGGLSARRRPRPRRWKARRFRRPLPAVYLLLLTFAALGGALYAPSNYDALTYRIPRILHWLAAGHWHWITTANHRMNYSGTAQDWAMSALYAGAPSDRAFFLLNLSAYALMPSLIFVTLRALGVRRRAAWVWMWLLPTAHIFALQAGSVGNDALALVTLLAALAFGTRAFAARAASRRSLTDLWIATLAAALLTSIKSSNIPLLLPCALAILPSWRLTLHRRLATAAILAVSLAISILPTAALNLHYTGAWTGDPTNTDHLKAADPISGIIGNTLQAAYINLTPPFVPHAADLNRAATRLIPTPLAQRLAATFPRFRLEVNELPQEEVAGLGIAISLLVLSCLASGAPPTPTVFNARWIIASGWLALAVFAASLSSEATARLLAPYYFLPIAGILRLGAADRHARHRLWRALALAGALTAVPALILTPSRPLIPATQIAAALAHRYPNNATAARAAAVYANYQQRPFAFAPVLAALPATAVHLDLIAGRDDPEATLWRPFGHRVVHDITTPAELTASHGDALICVVDGLDPALAAQIAELRTNGRIRWVVRVPVLTSVKRGFQPWDIYTRN